MTNIRGKAKVNPYPNKLPFDDIETLHECCDCEGCLCESLCKEYEEENFTKKITKKEGD